MTRPLTQSSFTALARRHFGFLSDDEPVIDRRNASFYATYASSPPVTVECWEKADLLEVSVVADGERLPIASQHTGQLWSRERLERAFSEQAEDLRSWLGRRA